MRKVATVTGTRAEYGILNPVLRAIQDKPDLKLLLVVTGMHLSHEFGYTVNEIEKDGFKISARVEMISGSDTLEAMAESVGRGIIGMARTWEQLKPDIILVLGDRVEPLSAAISGAYMNIPVAHIHGGDSPRGGLDEYARHAITKFAHIHFPATEKSAGRIIKMGEDEWRVHTVGSPAIDFILSEPSISVTALSQSLGVDLSQPFILVAQHPVTTQSDKATWQMRQTLEAVLATGYPAVVIYPNSDAGGRRMIDVIAEFEKHPSIKTFKSLPRKEYLSLMKLASVIVGNSSSAIIDSPSLGIPAVNIGIRQEGRERGDNIIDVTHDENEIKNAINKAISDDKFKNIVKKCRSPYGDGKSSQRIVDILYNLEITPQLLQKKLSY